MKINLKWWSLISSLMGMFMLAAGILLSFARLQTPSQWLVYADFQYTDGIELYRIRADGQQVERLTHDPQNAPIMERLPRWSPNGIWIAYAANDLNRHRIYRMNVNQQRPELVTEGAGYIHALAWSADGRSLIYDINDLGVRDHLRVSIWGGDPQPTDEAIPPDLPASTSPDGQWVVFTQYQMPQRTLGLYATRPTPNNAPISATRLNVDDAILLNDRLAADTAYSWSPLIDLPWHGFAIIVAGIVLCLMSLIQIFRLRSAATF